ncbi:metallophosphoesterase [Pontibacter actiniarum]|uniref:Serine/threonine protein phosphatase n=1 Tax=Pontibacter actiniarum TaxID=323450 RepID=A0A1X9YXY5_9BACT|nr:metallophosphoesterase [Pontibacter actiniarum]ARS37830.1 serine/threonine protein phosphatase [Pontibacter actiniarum]
MIWRAGGMCLLLLSALSGFAQGKKAFQEPKLSTQDSYTMVILPDLQNYVKFQRNQPILDVMMNWVVARKDSLNIGMVLCTGDLVEHDDIINPDGKKMDQTGRQQWLNVSGAFGKLDNQLPYVTATGNHDYNIFSYTHKPKTTHFPTYFYSEKNRENKKLLREVFTNVYGENSLENAAYEWLSPVGKKFLFLSLEFAPRDTVLGWAREVVAKDKYKDHTVILLTHAYLNYKNEHIESMSYDLTDANPGLAVWDKLVKGSKNIEMVVSGHIGAKDNARKHVGYRTDKNAAGKTVHQMTFNAQAMGGGHYGNGGDGWLRILEFLPDGKTVQVKTFSPFFALSPSTQHLAWRHANYDEFTFQFD